MGKNIVALIPFTLRYRKQIISVVSKIGTFRCIIFGCISTHNGSETFLSHQVIPSPSFHCQFTTTFLPDDFFQTLLVGFCYVGQCISCCSRDIRLLISSRIYRISFCGLFLLHHSGKEVQALVFRFRLILRHTSREHRNNGIKTKCL